MDKREWELIKQEYLKPAKKKETEKERKGFTIIFFSNTSKLKKPFQIFIPRKLIAAVSVVAMAAFIGAGLGFGINMNLKSEADKRAALNVELQQLQTQQNNLISENQNLKISIQDKNIQIQDMDSINSDNMQKLATLYERENEIRTELGLEPLGEVSTTSDAKEEASILNHYDVPEASNMSLDSSSNDDGDYKATLLLAQNSLNEHLANYDSYEVIIQSEQYKQAQREKEEAALRQSIVSYAKQFLGGRYVYGGSNPNTGTDCSGFTSYVLRNASGVYINRTAASQATQGKSVDIDHAQPGDLIFYSGGVGINHVAMYIGDGRVIHASNERNGIMISRWNYRNPVVIKDMLSQYY